MKSIFKLSIKFLDLRKKSRKQAKPSSGSQPSSCYFFWTLFYRFSEMDAQEACPGFMILEEDVAEDDEDIVIKLIFRLLFLYHEKKGVLTISINVACFR